MVNEFGCRFSGTELNKNYLVPIEVVEEYLL